MIIKIEGKCQYEGCIYDATNIASGQKLHFSDRPGHPGPGCYCADHAQEIENERAPEYTVSCPNCGCGFGVN